MGCSDSLRAEPQFVGQARKHIIAKFHAIYWLDATTIGARSLEGSIYWRKLLHKFCEFIEDQGEETMGVNIDWCGTCPFLCIKKDVNMVPADQMGPVERNAEENKEKE